MYKLDYSITQRFINDIPELSFSQLSRLVKQAGNAFLRGDIVISDEFLKNKLLNQTEFSKQTYLVDHRKISEFKKLAKNTFAKNLSKTKSFLILNAIILKYMETHKEQFEDILTTNNKIQDGKLKSNELDSRIEKLKESKEALKQSRYEVAKEMDRLHKREVDLTNTITELNQKIYAAEKQKEEIWKS